jgi:hypothetical protein
MYVPARGGVKRTTNESLGAIIGAIRRPVPLNPPTPSK